ncbi:uncharacterized protein ColSpa_11449 [Colletotrichum spaethianum]|uniref:Uncharacterized protein n=1 Tax=Colletotrichum spaethianum TaxID=700344 RepID=A0AA37PFJ7_9PEZI|nr:uncharacterized protein ColSpa_11449 [Colletotrichum spaethianum]GKT51268.1 hypothetical protein ColSpa_11449 [Colletotrichum spaethianum]
MVSCTYLLTLLAATAAIASPVRLSNQNGTVKIRQSGQVYVCKAGANNDGVTYGEVSQDCAIGYFREAGTKAGFSGYPKKFDNKGNVMKFASGCNENVYELPVFSNGKRYDFNAKKGSINKPGPMRVYYTKDLKFCGVGAKEHIGGTGNPHNCVLENQGVPSQGWLLVRKRGISIVLSFTGRLNWIAYVGCLSV